MTRLSKLAFGHALHRSCKKPVPVTCGVPIETSIEHRRQRTRRCNLTRTIDHVREVVRILASYGVQRKFRIGLNAQRAQEFLQGLRGNTSKTFLRVEFDSNNIVGAIHPGKTCIIAATYRVT